MVKPLITITLACKCGYHQTATDNREYQSGGCYGCNNCGQAWARITPWMGGDAWIKVSESDVKFYRLFDLPEEDLDDYDVGEPLDDFYSDFK